jgi:hypothetical protein
MGLSLLSWHHSIKNTMKKIFIATAIFLYAITVRAQNNIHPNHTIKMENTLIQNVKKLFEDVDRRNWPGVKAAMAQNVELDFSSLSGNPPSIQSSDSIVSAWRNFLPGFDSTRHQLTDFKVTQTGDNAIVTYHGLANHYLDKDIWTVEANYESQLTKINGAWLLSKHKLSLIKQSGNTDLPSKAAEKVKSKGVDESKSPEH